MLAYEPGWLYSTIAQSSAAILALCGSFAIARVIQVSSVRGDLERRRRSSREYLSQLETDKNILSDLIDERELQKLVDDHLVVIFKSLKLEVLPDVDASEYDLVDCEDKIHAAIARARDEMKRVFQLFEERHRLTKEFPPRDVERMRAVGYEVDSGNERLWSFTAQRFCEGNPLSRNSILGIFPPGWGGQFSFPGLLDPVRDPEGTHEKHRGLKRVIEAETSALADLDRQLKYIPSLGATSRIVRHLIIGGTLGVVVPVSLLSISPIPSSLGIRILALSAFVISLYSVSVVVRQIASSADNK